MIIKLNEIVSISKYLDTLNIFYDLILFLILKHFKTDNYFSIKKKFHH